MIEMIESAHINATAGFLNVQALDTDTLQVKGMQAIIAASAAALNVTNWDGITSNSAKTPDVCWEVL
ncbi:hypothetical protein BDR07DRAFT_1485468 [Suillus spraguei]|nr:hypothetical protein BDR07DRAFT_1485468 [Suillus spraguei]